MNESSFCYDLFENNTFSMPKMRKLILDARYLRSHGDMDDEIARTIKWIIQGIDQCFTSHHDLDDLYEIKNYTLEIEHNWYDVLRQQLLNAIHK